MEEDERAIRQVIADWITASAAGDADRLSDLIAEDAVFSVPGREPFGKPDFFEAFRAMADLQMETESQIVELQLIGDWAFVRSHIRVAVTPPAGEARRHAGFTLTLFRKDGHGQWRLARDANMLVPEP